jgi:hypothetical protein
MLIKQIKYKKGYLDLKVPTKLSEYTLSQAIQLAKIDAEIIDFQEKYDDLLFNYELGEKELDGEYVPYDREDFDLDVCLLDYEFALRIIKKLLILCPKSKEDDLRLIPEATLIHEYNNIINSIKVTDAYTTHEFYFPKATKVDLQLLQAEYAEFSKLFDSLENKTFKDLQTKEIYEKRLKALAEGHFMVHPVRDVLFGTYMDLYKTRNELPTVPENIMSDMEEDETFEEYINRIEGSEQTELTPDQKINLTKQKYSLKRYMNEYEQGVLEALPRIISHLCVPVLEEYNNNRADERAVDFLQLPMDIVCGVRNFFFHLRNLSQNWNLSLDVFFNLSPTNQAPLYVPVTNETLDGFHS